MKYFCGTFTELLNGFSLEKPEGFSFEINKSLNGGMCSKTELQCPLLSCLGDKHKDQRKPKCIKGCVVTEIQFPLLQYFHRRVCV